MSHERLQDIRKGPVESTELFAKHTIVVYVIMHHECEGARVPNSHDSMCEAMKDVEVVKEINGAWERRDKIQDNVVEEDNIRFVPYNLACQRNILLEYIGGKIIRPFDMFGIVIPGRENSRLEIWMCRVIDVVEMIQGRLLLRCGSFVGSRITCYLIDIVE